MQLKMKTSELQEMVGKVIHCVSNNKLIPLTSLMSIGVKDNIFTLITTDATNYFYATKPEKVDCEDFEVSVIADTFTKLVQKTTSDETTISIEGKILCVKGNGTYKMELPLDENGSVIKFPKKVNSDFTTMAGTLKVSTVKAIINSNKPSLATNMEMPSLTNYYCGDTVITSDRKRVCRTDIKMFDKPLLITPTLMELLSVVSFEDIVVSYTDEAVIFTTSTDTIYSPLQDGVDTFPVDAINKLVDLSFSSNCRVSRTAILNILDRLALFVGQYDKQGIYMTFTNEGILFSSKKSSGEELIPYITSDNFTPYTCCINIEFLRSQIQSQDSDEIDLYYGSNVAIKLLNKNVTQIIALLEDDRVN